MTPVLAPLPDRDDLVRAYAFPADRSWVRAIFVASLDGAAADADGVSGSLGGTADAEVFALQRSLADVVVVAAGTARAEGYEPVRRHEVDADLRAALGLAPTPAVAVVTASLDVPPALLVRPAAGEAETLVITTTDPTAEQIDALGPHVRVVRAGSGRVDLAAALDVLTGSGLRRVVAEGGPSLLGGLLAADLVDDLALTVAPALLAGDAPRIATGPALVPPLSMTLRHAYAADDALLTRWERVRADAPAPVHD